ncbi:MAG: hypothetical protein AAGD01_17775 [Acidobacteriota bacterium]
MLALVLSVLVVAPAAIAQESNPATVVEAPAVASAVDSAVVSASGGDLSGSELRSRIESVWTVTTDGQALTLTPLRPGNGVETIAVEGDEVRINGAPTTSEVRRAWLGIEDHELLEELLAASGLRRQWLAPAAPGESASAEDPAPESVTESALESRAVQDEPTSGELNSSELATSREEAEGVRGALPSTPDPPNAEALTPESQSAESQSAESQGAELQSGETSTPETLRRPSLRKDSDDLRLAVGNDVTVSRDEVVADAVAFGGSVEILGVAQGDVAAFGDDVEVEGEVLGSVTSIGGDVRLRESSRVVGDVLSIGGEVRREDGAEVGGDISEVSGGRFNFGPFFSGRDYAPQAVWWPQLWSSGWAFGDALLALLRALMLAVVMVVITFVAPGTVERTATIAARDPWQAGFFGLLASLAWVLLSLAFLVSCIGAVVLPFLWLAVLILYFIGYAAVAGQVGGWSRRRFGWGLASPALAVFVGTLLIQSVTIVAKGLAIGGWVLWVAAVLTGLFGWSIRFSAWMVGFGALVMAPFQKGGHSGAGPNSPDPSLPPLPLLPSPESPSPAPDPEDEVLQDQVSTSQDSTGQSSSIDPSALPSEEELRAEFEASLEQEDEGSAEASNAPSEKDRDSS